MMKLLVVTTGLGVASANVRGARELSECASVPTNQYCHLIDRHSKMALNIANGATWAGASAVQWEELADLHDNWRFESSSDGHFNLIAEHSNLPLVAQGSSWGANVAQGNEKDDWCMVDQGNGYYKVKHRGSGMVLDTVDDSHGANVVLKSNSDNENQQWRLNCFKDTTPETKPCKSVPSDKYCHIIAQHSQMALNVDFGSTSSGGKIVQYYDSGDDHYNFKMVPSSNNNYKIVNKKSGLALAAEGGTKGDDVVQTEGGDDWCFIDENDGYYEIKNSNSGLALDIYKVRSDPQTQAVVWPWGDGQANRKFRLDCNHGSVDFAPLPPKRGCTGFLDACHLIGINTGSVQELTAFGKDTYSLAETDQYTVRCDVTGSVDQFDFFYDGKRHSNWGAPYHMDYANDSWTQPVDMFKTCGTKTFRVSAKTWGDGKCFEANYELEAPC